MKIDVKCFTCGKVHSFEDIVSFRAECDQCAADLHVCLTCRFYDKYVENECRETEADFVANKDRRNLCEYWKARAGGDVDDEAARAKAKLDALFKKPAAPATSAPTTPSAQHASSAPAAETPEQAAKRKLDELFKKK